MALRSEGSDEDGYSSISGETLQKAMTELQENPATRGNMVRELRGRILFEESEVGDIIAGI